VRYPGNASPEGVTTDPQKLEAVQRWHRRGTNTNYGAYLVYVPTTGGFADIVKPLTKFTEENSYQWSQQAYAAIRSLKVSLYDIRPRIPVAGWNVHCRHRCEQLRMHVRLCTCILFSYTFQNFRVKFIPRATGNACRNT
jgi:hypothetical protein